MKKQELVEKARLALRAALKEDDTVAEKAYAARKLADVIMELCHELGPENAGRLFRAISDEEEKRSPVSDKEDSFGELIAVLEEMDAQQRRMN